MSLVMRESFLYTIKERAESLYKEKGSKFIAVAFPVANEEEIKKNRDDLKKLYFDARHHCFAYILADSPEKFRAFDDGEPRHSAGDPILGQIRSKQLENILVVVVRYFGGTKLGKSGLINAYKTAAAEALNNAVIIEKTITRTFHITFDYEVTNEVLQLVHSLSVNIVHQDFAVQCKFKLAVLPNQLEEVTGKFQQIKNVKVEII